MDEDSGLDKRVSVREIKGDQTLIRTTDGTSEGWGCTREVLAGLNSVWDTVKDYKEKSNLTLV